MHAGQDICTSALNNARCVCADLVETELHFFLNFSFIFCYISFFVKNIILFYFIFYHSLIYPQVNSLITISKVRNRTLMINQIHIYFIISEELLQVFLGSLKFSILRLSTLSLQLIYLKIRKIVILIFAHILTHYIYSNLVRI